MGLPNRQAIDTPAVDREGGHRAVNPTLVLILRFLLTALVCGLALATSIMCILVVEYYNTHDPIVRPSWGTLIYLIFLGFFTGFIYIGYNILMPLAPFIHYGGFLYGLFYVKIELLLQFAMTVFWIVGAIAYSVDLGGRENCTFDGYYHYPKPADFNHVCDLTNWAIPLAYATAGVQIFLWFVESAFGLYTFLFLDQESFNEPMFEWGRRAYNWRLGKDHNGASTTQPQYRARVDATSRGGRRGAAYADPEADMAQHSGQNATVGARGRRGATYGDDDHVLNDEDESGWHLREDPSQRA